MLNHKNGGNQFISTDFSGVSLVYTTWLPVSVLVKSQLQIIARHNHGNHEPVKVLCLWSLIFVKLTIALLQLKCGQKRKQPPHLLLLTQFIFTPCRRVQNTSLSFFPPFSKTLSSISFSFLRFFTSLMTFWVIHHCSSKPHLASFWPSPVNHTQSNNSSANNTFWYNILLHRPSMFFGWLMSC